MTPKTWKRIILGILACVMIYIWWGNIELFWLSSSTSAVRISSPTRQPISHTPHISVLKQYDVKANPFRRWGVSTPPAITSTSALPTVEIARLSKGMHLVGVLVESERPQAVLQINDTQSVVLSLRDTLEGWSLIGVAKDRAWFGHNALQDTLYLYESID